MEETANLSDFLCDKPPRLARDVTELFSQLRRSISSCNERKKNEMKIKEKGAYLNT